MPDAINTGNPVSTTKFIVNKYDDIDGNNHRVSQETPRGRLCFKDTNGRMTLPRTQAEAAKAVYPVDWAKPLNPPPYYDGPGLNGALPNALDDGSLDMQVSNFSLDMDQNFVANWPVGYKQYDIPPMFYDLPVTSGNKCLVWDGGTFTYGSGNYAGSISDYTIGQLVYTASEAGSEGKLTTSGVVSVGHVHQRETFGPGTLTVKLKGTAAR